MPEFIAHTVEGSTSRRVGLGRWSTVMTPCPGVLWTNDVDAVGFLAIGQVGDTIFDSIDIDDTIQAHVDTGKTATEVFERVAGMVGKSISEGDLTTWRHPALTMTAQIPDISHGEILQAARDGEIE